MIYNPSNWYWIVAGDTSKAWSSAAAGFVDADDEAYVSWLDAGGGTTPISSLAELTDVFATQYPGGMLKTYAAYVRWRKETGGITVGGVPVLTDDRAQLKIAGARIAADADPEWTTVWDGADGGSYPIDAPTMIAISNAVQAHVNNDCFKEYADVKAAILSGTITTREQIDAAFAG